MQVNFKLKRPHEDGPTAIRAVLYKDNKRFLTGVRRSIHPRQWDFKKQRPKPSYPAAAALTAYLDSVSAAVIEKYNWIAATGGYFTKEDFEQAVHSQTGKVRAGMPTIIQHLDSLAEGQPRSSLYPRLASKVKKFVKDKRMPAQMEAINEAWFDGFQDYLIANNAEGYAYRLSKQLRTACRLAKFEWPGKQGILNAKLKARNVTNEEKSVSLSFEQMRAISAADLQGRAADVSKMLFVACTTGLRISDWHKFRLDANIIEAEGCKFIELRQRKTEGIAYPPLFGISEKMLLALGGSLVPQYWRHLSNEGLRHEFNKAVRAMAPKVGLDPKNLTSKIARKTFTSRFRELGLSKDLTDIMSGHAGKRRVSDYYDTNQFRDMAPQIIPFVRKFEEKLYGGGLRLSFL